MIPFIILFIYLGILSYFTSSIVDNDKKRKLQAFWGGLGLWSLLALRSWTCGMDLYYSELGTGYILKFIKLGEASLKDVLNSNIGYEPGFKILNWLIFRCVSNNPQFMLAITGGIEIALIGYTFYKQSPKIILSYIAFACLGLYIFSFSGIRQGLGFAFTFFAFNFIEDRRPWKFLIFILLGITMHTSSVIFIPAYLVKNLSLSSKKAFIGILIVFLFLPFLMPVIQFFSVLLYGKEKYSSFQGDAAYNLLILYILLLLFSYLVDAKGLQQNRKITQVRWMSLIAIFLQSSGILSAGALSRIAFSYSIFFSLLLPYTVSVSAIKSRRQWEFIIVFLLICFFLYVNKDGYLNVIPYRFFWDEVYNL